VSPDCPLPEPELLQRVAALQSQAPHPLAHAFLAAVGDPKAGQSVTNFRYHPGLGLEGTVGKDGQPHLSIGSARFMERMGLRLCPAIRGTADLENAPGKTAVFVGWDGNVEAALFFQERIREEAAHVLERLRAMGIRVAVLTGDRVAPFSPLTQLFPALEVKAGLLPQDKVQEVRTGSRSGGPVAMVGDGINDAPALAAADVGVALGTGTDLTREAADVNVLGPDLGKVLWIVEYARRARRTIRGNLFWAFAYNGIAMVFAAAGRLNPLVAAAAMIGSSLFILWNSRRLANG
jgi:P-type E1-E2 ATPase